MDLFVVPTIGFSLLYAFVIVHLDRRNLGLDQRHNHTKRGGGFGLDHRDVLPCADTPNASDRIFGAVVTPIARHGHPAVKQHACGTSYPTKRLSVISGRRS